MNPLNPLNPWVMLAAAVLLAIAFTTGLGTGNHYGRQEVQAKWDKQTLANAQALHAAIEHQTVVTQASETVYLDRVRVVHDHGETIIKEVTKYVPRTDPDLSGGFRLLHDAAASGEPLPGPAAGADAAPVAAQEAAATVTSNYEACRANAETVKGFQEWARGQQAAGAR